MLLELKGLQILDAGMGVWGLLVCIVLHWKSGNTWCSDWPLNDPALPEQLDDRERGPDFPAPSYPVFSHVVRIRLARLVYAKPVDRSSGPVLRSAGAGTGIKRYVPCRYSRLRTGGCDILEQILK